MNRYPWWKYLIIALAMFIGLMYSLPNVFGEAPAVQLSSGKATVKLDADATKRVQAVLESAGVQADFVELDGTSVRARFKDTDAQIKARDAISRAFNPDPADPRYIVALNLVSRSPQWLSSLHAFPMYLGLDLRGGVHFLLQVDIKAALTKRLEALAGDIRAIDDDIGRVIAAHAVQRENNLARAHCSVPRGLLLGRRAVGQDRHVLAVVAAMRADHVRPLQLATVLALDMGH